MQDQSPSQSFILRWKAIKSNILTESVMGKECNYMKNPGKSTEVKIKISVMTKREDVLVVKRLVILSVTVRTNIKYEELLKKAVKKHY